MSAVDKVTTGKYSFGSVIAHFVGRSAVLRDVITEFVNQVKTKLISKFQAIYKNYLRFYNDTIILTFIKLMEPILHVNCCLNLNEWLLSSAVKSVITSTLRKTALSL